MDKPSAFIISLDFELHWGGFEKWPLDNYRNYFLNTRATIPRMLALFRKFDVHVTWAGVGLLFHETKEQILEDAPAIKPTYREAYLSAYHYIETNGIGPDEASDPFHYGFTLLKNILSTPNQEVGSHTFSHYYCNEPGQTLEQFRMDLRAARKAASRLNITLKSLVFPRNQFNDAYLNVCFQEGFIAVRSNPADWFWNIQSAQREPFWKRLNRGADAYLPVGARKSFRWSSIVRQSQRPACIPASRLLRPYRPSEWILNDLKIARIKSELHQAALHKEVYHLWWHPHNFGNYPNESLRQLEAILRCYSEMREKYGMVSLNMEEVAQQVAAS